MFPPGHLPVHRPGSERLDHREDIEARDLDVALTLAAEGSKSCNRRVEVRPFA
jgi:hypothetical protein